MIIPSIDLMGGKAVQLIQGKKKVLEIDDPVGLAMKFSMFGEIAVIDLDAALGKGDNFDIIKKICSIADCRVGGGIRTEERARETLKAGAKKIIIGTCAERKFLSVLPKESLIVAIDSKGGNIVDKGWTEVKSKTPLELMAEVGDLCSEFLFTDVDNEGMMKGFDFEKIKQISDLSKKLGVSLTVAGSISSKEDIKKLEQMDISPQLGMALYTNKIDLAESFIFTIDFEKCDGLVPTIVKDELGNVLMFAYSSKESLAKSFATKKATYFSRTRGSLWTKGETSGNSQELLKARYDCDKDALLFTVRQAGNACHLPRYSCFWDDKYSLEKLYSVIIDRMRSPKQGSYTSRLLSSEGMIKEKIIEEAEEVVSYTSRENLVWEIADLTYFVTCLMAKNGITIKEIYNELRGREK